MKIIKFLCIVIVLMCSGFTRANFYNKAAQELFEKWYTALLASEKLSADTTAKALAEVYITQALTGQGNPFEKFLTAINTVNLAHLAQQYQQEHTTVLYLQQQAQSDAIFVNNQNISQIVALAWNDQTTKDLLYEIIFDRQKTSVSEIKQEIEDTIANIQNILATRIGDPFLLANLNKYQNAYTVLKEAPNTPTQPLAGTQAHGNSSKKTVLIAAGLISVPSILAIILASIALIHKKRTQNKNSAEKVEKPLTIKKIS